MGARPAGRRTRWLVAAAIAATAVVPWVAQAAQNSVCGVNPDKCYSFTMSVDPQAPQPGQEAVYTGTLTNLSRGGSGVQIGSARVTWSPADAFSSVTAGTVSPRGGMEVVGRSIELHDLGVAPGSSASFTFTAVALRPVTVTFRSTAKQANRYAGAGNDLFQTGPDPSTTVTGSCGGAPVSESYGCGAVKISDGGTVCTGGTRSAGGPSAVRSCLTLPPVPGAAGWQQVVLANFLGGDACPVEPLECSYVSQLLSKLALAYDSAHGATLGITCGTACPAIPLYFQVDERRNIKEPLLPCLPVGPLPSPLTGSLACYTDNGDGTVDVLHVTSVNDYKVMG
jgi:hypothetical protein